jgi:hypothetical protein
MHHSHIDDMTRSEPLAALTRLRNEDESITPLMLRGHTAHDPSALVQMSTCGSCCLSPRATPRSAYLART